MIAYPVFDMERRAIHIDRIDGMGPEVDIEVFKLRRPAVRKCGLNAGTDCPANPCLIARQRIVATSAGLRKRHLVFGFTNGQTASRVDQPTFCRQNAYAATKCSEPGKFPLVAKA